jgi:hypothetical protein
MSARISRQSLVQKGKQPGRRARRGTHDLRSYFEWIANPKHILPRNLGNDASAVKPFVSLEPTYLAGERSHELAGEGPALSAGYSCFSALTVAFSFR